MHSFLRSCRSLTLLFAWTFAANAASLTFTNLRPFNGTLLDTAGDIVTSTGTGLSSRFTEHLASGVTYSPDAYPSSGPAATAITYVSGINDSGTLAGYYGDGIGGVHGFVFNHGTYTPMDALTYTYATAVNNRGDIAGYAGTVAPDAVQAFLLLNGTVVTSGFPALGFLVLPLPRASTTPTPSSATTSTHPPRRSPEPLSGLPPTLSLPLPSIRIPFTPALPASTMAESSSAPTSPLARACSRPLPDTKASITRTRFPAPLAPPSAASLIPASSTEPSLPAVHCRGFSSTLHSLPSPPLPAL